VFKLRGPVYLKTLVEMGAAPATGAEAEIAAFEVRCAARAEATAGSSAGTLAPLGKSTSLVSKLKAPDL